MIDAISSIVSPHTHTHEYLVCLLLGHNRTYLWYLYTHMNTSVCPVLVHHWDIRIQMGHTYGTYIHTWIRPFLVYHWDIRMQMGLPVVPIHTNEYLCLVYHCDIRMQMYLWYTHEYLCLSRPCIRLGDKDASGTYLWYVYNTWIYTLICCWWREICIR